MIEKHSMIQILDRLKEVHIGAKKPECLTKIANDFAARAISNAEQGGVSVADIILPGEDTPSKNTIFSHDKNLLNEASSDFDRLMGVSEQMTSICDQMQKHESRSGGLFNISLRVVFSLVLGGFAAGLMYLMEGGNPLLGMGVGIAFHSLPDGVFEVINLVKSEKNYSSCKKQVMTFDI